MPKSWKKSDLIAIFKGKEDHMDITEVSVKLLERGVKLIERQFEEQLRNVVKLDKMSIGFVPGRTIDAIFILQQMLKKNEIAKTKLNVVC